MKVPCSIQNLSYVAIGSPVSQKHIQCNKVLLNVGSLRVAEIDQFPDMTSIKLQGNIHG